MAINGELQGVEEENKRKGRNKCPESRMVKADQEFDMIRRCLRVLGGNKVKEDDDVDKENLFKNYRQTESSNENFWNGRTQKGAADIYNKNEQTQKLKPTENE